MSPVRPEEVAGAALAVASAALYDVGYILEKQALTRLPPVGLGIRSVLRTASSSLRWRVGFGIMLVALAVQVIALTLAPVAVVQPVLAGGLIALAAAGPAVLGERLTRREVAALALVVLAVVLTAVSSAGSVPVARSVRGSALGLLAGGGAAAAAVVGGRPGRGLTVVRASLAAGLLYGVGAVAEKAVATLLSAHGVPGGALRSLGTVYPWLFVVATFAGMVFFQAGLQAHAASLIAGLTNTVSTGTALAGAAVVFGERLLPTGWWAVARVAGLAAVVAALTLLSGNDRVRQEPAPGAPVPAPAG